MRSAGIKIVIDTISIGGHGYDGIELMLTRISLAHDDAINFGGSISNIGRFDLSVEKHGFLHGLLCEFRISAGRAREKQFFDAIQKGGMNDIAMHLRIVINEFRRISIVGMNTSDNGGKMEDIIRLVLCKIIKNGLLVAQVQFGSRWCQKRVILLFQSSCKCASYHSRAAGNEYFCIFIHNRILVKHGLELWLDISAFFL